MSEKPHPLKIRGVSGRPGKQDTRPAGNKTADEQKSAELQSAIRPAALARRFMSPTPKFVLQEQAAATAPRDVDAAFELCCALSFVVGSYYFVAQALAGDDWIPPYRVGSAWWVGGCVFGFVPPFRQFARAWRHRAACTDDQRNTYALLQVGGMAGYGIGCSLSFFPDCCIPLGPINILFCLGSACLVGDPALQLARTWRTCRRVDLVVLVADLFAGFFFCCASVFGGYASDQALIVSGEACWGVGSLLALVKPCAHFTARLLERPADSASKTELV